MPSEQAQKMAALFNINFNSSFEESSDYDAKAKDSARVEQFENKVKTMQLMMEPEPFLEEKSPSSEPAKESTAVDEFQSETDEDETETETEDELLLGALKDVAKGVNELDILSDGKNELEIPDGPLNGLTKTEVDMALDFAKRACEAIPETTKPEAKPEVVIAEAPEAPEAPKQPEVKEDNPLGLIGNNYRFFKQLESDYPQFTAYNGQVAYKDFYCYKIQVLRATLTRFPILIFSDMRHELRSINADHTVGTNASPEAIRAKLDESYRSRIRVAQMLAETNEQFFVWESNIELLESRLWTDHEQRGAHKRAALTLAHMHGEILYVKEMQGFMQSAKIIDTLLKDGSESLSRQLTCIQLKEPSSADHTLRYTLRYDQEVDRMRKEQTTTEKQDTKMDELDGISEGSVISAPERNREPRIVDSLGKFDPDDDLMNLK